jgi:hypothetical protein
MIHPELVSLYLKLINISPSPVIMKLTFEDLKTLSESNPDAVEEKVQEILEEYIQTLAPERQQRARAYNWRVQQELRKFKDPIARMNKMVEMFWKGVRQFQTALVNPEVLLNQKGEAVAIFPKKPQ